MQFSSSNTVDSRVVELRFDNSQFESNAKTSLSTLDRLKKSLDFSKHKTTFVDIGNGLRSISIAPLAAGLDGVTAKFSNLEIMGKRALEALTDDIYRTSKAFLESVTIKQVEQGWGKYAEKTSAVQTIMAATAKDFNDTAEQMEYVNTQLDKLNWFTDETSYNFLEMVNSIGKFTSNNIELDKSVTAMEGISNWAAISGANAQMATHAMYNLSQAIATGSVKLMDWKSIENANMATAEFKQTAIETAEAMGTLKKVSDNEWETLDGKAKVSVANFNEGLQKGWFTSEVLLDTLQKYGAFTDKLSESLDQLGDDMYASKLLGFIDEYKEGTLNLEEAAGEAGVSASKLKEILDVLGSDEYEFGRKAFRAAQEAKTFQEAVDSVKDAVSTGWMNTFEIMFGDYVQAKSLWTGLAENLYTIFAEGGNARNKLLKEAFNKEETINQADWDKLSKAGLANPLFIKAIKDAAKSHSDTAKKIKDDQEWLTYALREGVITAGDFQTAWDKVFNQTKKSNSALADSIKKARESDKEFDALFGTMEKFGASDLEGITWGNHIYDANREAEESVDKVLKKLGLEQSSGEEVVEVLKSMGLFGGIANEEIAHLSDEELRSIGFTEEMITAYKDAIAGGKDALSVRDAILTANMSTGEIWFDTLAQGMDAVVKLFEVAQEEWENIFPPATVDTVRAVVLTLHDAVVHFKDFVETNEALRASFRGLFAAIDIVRMVVTGLVKGAFQVLRALMEGLGLDIGGIVIKISDFVIKAREWLKSSQLIQKGINLVSTIANLGGKQLRLWFDQFKNIPGLSKHFESFKTGFKSAFQNLPTFVDGLTDKFKEFGKKVGEMDGIRLDNIGDVFTAFKDTVLSYFMEFPGFQALRDAFEQLKEDVKNKLSEMGIDTEDLKKKWEGFKASAVSIFGAIGNAAVAAFGYIVALYDKISKSEFVQTNLARFKNAFSDFPEQFSKFIEGLGEKFDEFKAKVKEIGGFSFDNISEIWTAFGDTVGQFFEDFTGFDSIKQAFVDLKNDVKAKLLEMGIDVDGIKEKITGFIDDVKQALANFSLPSVFQDVISFFTGSNEDLEGSSDTISSTFEAVTSAAEEVQQKAGSLPQWFKDLSKAVLGFIVALAALKTLGIVKDAIESLFSVKNAMAKDIKSNAFLKMAIAIGLLAGSIVLLATQVSPGQLWSTFGAIAALYGLLVIVSVAVEKLTNAKNMDKVGTGILAIAGSIMVLALAIKVLETVKPENVDKVAKLLGLLALGITLMGVALGRTKGLFGAGVGLLSMAASLIVLIGVIKLLDGLTVENPIKVVFSLITLVGALALMFFASRAAGKRSMLAATSILAMAGALAIMAAAVGLITLLNQDKLLAAVGVIGALSLCLDAMMLAAKGLKGGAAMSILMMGIVIAALAVSLAGLTFLDTTKLAAVAVVLGALMLVLGLFMKFLKNTETTKYNAASVLQLVALAAIILLLGNAVKKIADIGDTTKILVIMGGLILIFGSMALLCLACAKVGQAGPAALLGVAAVALVLAGVSLALGLLAEYTDVDKLLPVAKSLALVIASLALLMVGLAVLSAASLGVGPALIALAAVVGVFLALSGLFAVIEHFTDGGFGEALQKGIELMVSIGDGIGRFFGALIGGFSEESTKALPEIAQTLVDFMTKLQEIPSGSINWEALQDALGAIVQISGTELLTALPNAISKWTTGRTALEQFSNDLDWLSTGLITWSERMSSIGAITVDTQGINSLAKAIGRISFTEILDGISSWFVSLTTGENKTAISQFGENLSTLATALSGWQTTLSSIGEIVVPTEKINKLSGLISDLSFSSIMTAIGAKVKEFITGDGESPIETFKSQTSTLATTLTEWQASMDSLGEIKVPTDKITELSTAIESVPSTGIFGAIGTFIKGSTDIEDFSESVGYLGDGLKAFSDALGEDFDSEAVSSAADAVRSLGELGNLLKGQDFGGWFSENDYEQFGEGLITLAPYLKEFSEIEIDAGKIETLGKAAKLIGQATNIFSGIEFTDSDLTDTILVQQFKTSLDTLVEALNGLLEIDDSGVTKFTNAISTLADTDISGLKDKLSEAVGSGENKTMSLDAGKSMNEGIAEGMADTSSVTSAVSNLTGAATGEIERASGDFTTKAAALVEAMASGVRQSSAFMDAISELIQLTISSIDTNALYDSGVYLVDGFAQGIFNRKTEAIARATELARATMNAVNQTIGAHSPARELIKSGKWFDMGFALGIERNAYMSEEASEELGARTMDAMQDAINGITDILSSDIDAQPVIRPVFDLSDIRNGAGTISSILDGIGSEPIVSNLNAISDNVAASRTRATSDDILGALTALQGFDRSGDTYNINGVTYDDGSNITDAVRTLVRAVVVGGRA